MDLTPSEPVPRPEAEAYYRSLIENSGDVVTVMHPSGVIQFESPSISKVLGYAPEDLIGKNAFTLIHPEDRMRVMAIFARGLVQPGQPQAVRFRFRHKDGEWRRLESIGKFLADRKFGMRVVISSRDITNRLEAHEALERLAAIVENSDDAIVSWRSDGIIDSWNSGAERIFGYSARDIIGQSIERLIPVDQKHKTPSFLNLLQSGERVRQLETTSPHKDGRLVNVSISVSPLRGGDGKMIGASGVARDISERKRVENAVLQQEKMSAVGRLAAGVAHEINNPLAVILGFAESIGMRLKTDDPLKGPMESILREAKRCRTLVQDLLSFSRTPKVGFTPQAPIETIEGALSLVESQARIRRITVHRIFANNLPQVSMDRSQIQQVLINLCTNAMDAMPHGGKLIIGLENAKNELVLSVGDTGGGIPESAQSHIFEPFFTTKEMGKGTGLGLSLVYDIVTKHHGTIDFETHPGQGTTFRVRLPLVTPAAQKAA
jgi:PAS domain S-box-containing protein